MRASDPVFSLYFESWKWDPGSKFSPKLAKGAVFQLGPYNTSINHEPYGGATRVVVLDNQINAGF